MIIRIPSLSVAFHKWYISWHCTRPWGKPGPNGKYDGVPLHSGGQWPRRLNYPGKYTLAQQAKYVWTQTFKSKGETT